jgi:hypothetical protein
MNYQLSDTWKRSFSPTAPDLHTQARQRLSAGLEQFRRHVKPVADEIALSVPGYTDHSIGHCDALWDIADLFVDENFPLNPAEAFVLGGAFLVHDLGMGLAAHSEGLAGILGTESWLDHLAALYPDAFEALQSAATRDVQANPTWDGLTSPKVKDALTIYLREHHAAQAERVVSQEWKLSNGQSFYLLADTELRHWYGELIGRIGRSHWRGVEELPEEFNSTFGSPPGLPTEWTVDAVKVACILRVADAAQVDARRADPLHTPFRQPQGSSLPHWEFQERMLHPILHKDRLMYTSTVPFPREQAVAWWLGFDTVQMIDQELRKVDALLADSNRPQLRARAVLGAEAANRFARYVKTDGWTPVDARPKITNTESVISNLGGTALYGQAQSIVIRELLANAVDATRLRRLAYGDDGMRPIRVTLESVGGSDYLDIRDYGIGMDADDVVTYLCDFGRSGWRSKTVRSAHPGALASGYQSTGQFGIGFYSSFMAADEVTVTTRPFHAGSDDTHVLEFGRGISERPLLRRAERTERLYEPGTRIRLKLRQSVEAGLLFPATRSQVRSDFMEVVRQQSLLCDEMIEVVPLGASSPELVNGGSGWRGLAHDALFDRLQPTVSQRRRGSRSGRSDETYRKHFLDFAMPLHDADGAVQGVLAIDVLDHGEKDHGAVSPTGGIYCGGFYAEPLYSFVGVISGIPEKASRDRAIPLVSREEFSRWLNAQVDLAVELDLSHGDRLSLAAMVIETGSVRADLPIAVTAEGYASPGEFRAWAGSRDRVVMFEDPMFVLDREDGPIVYDHLTERMLLVPPSAAVFTYGGSLGPMGRLFERLSAADAEVLAELDGDDVERSWEVADWWVTACRLPIGRAVRELADAWGTSLVSLLRTMKSPDSDPVACKCEARDASRDDGPVTRLEGLVFERA